MPNYQLGKMYKIVDNTNENVYVGSTCEPTLARRLAKHKSNYNVYLSGKGTYTTSYIVLENGDYDIVLIENYPCNNKDELFARERYHIERIKCVNKLMPIRTKQEHCEYKKNYYETNKEYLALNRKIYELDNKEKIKTRKSTEYICECGKSISANNKARHEKTKFHLNYVNNL